MLTIQASKHPALRRRHAARGKALRALCCAMAALVALALLPSAPASAETVSLKFGMSGAAVKTLQAHLVKRGYLTLADGKYGPGTLAAVKRFQSHAGLPADGVAGAKTQSVLYNLVGTGKTNVTLRPGARSAQITLLQKRLAALGYLSVSTYTNYYGTATKTAVVKFQRKAGLSADGTAGPKTLVRLYSPSAPKYQTKGQLVVEYAKKYLGSKYVYGTAGPTTFDCSGLIYYVFKTHFNTIVPRSSKDMVNAGAKVEGGLSNARPGDILCFGNSLSTVGHVAIYVGNNQYLHAPQTGEVVKIETLSQQRINTCVAVRRIFND